MMIRVTKRTTKGLSHTHLRGVRAATWSLLLLLVALPLSAREPRDLRGGEVAAEEAGFDAKRLAKVDSIIRAALLIFGRRELLARVLGRPLSAPRLGPRVGLCMGPEHIAQGWHSGATLGVFSAASGAARGLRLDVDRTVHALGIAGTQAAGLMAAQYGAMVKRMHAGRSSQSGLYGALFAEAGFTGIINVLESEYGGFCTTFSRSTDRFNLKELTAGFGEVWQTMGVALKFYACVGSNHTTLDAIRALQQERRWRLSKSALAFSGS